LFLFCEAYQQSSRYFIGDIHHATARLTSHSAMPRLVQCLRGLGGGGTSTGDDDPSAI
jgi:hypothetical protein